MTPMIEAAVVTVSDRCARGDTEDTSGPAVAQVLARLPARVADPRLVPDDPDAIAEVLRELVRTGTDLVVTTGGTGCGIRDVTPEATLAVIERRVPGLAEAMRSASSTVTPFAWLSRGVCGTAGRTLIVNLPGSRKGAVENLEAIIDVIPHAVRQLRGDTDHPEAEADRHPSIPETPPGDEG